MDDKTRREIDKVVEGILNDAGLREPPVKVGDLLQHLEVHRDFYDLKDPNLLQRFLHRMKVGTQKLIKIVDKVRLHAVWLPDEERILVDDSLPDPKIEWASFHDTTHRILPWHRPFFLGDTAQTLDPDFQEMLENEANYGASALMFAGDTFTKDALDTAGNWESVTELKKKYKKSLVTTVRRYVEFGLDRAMVMVVSTPWWREKPPDQDGRIRHSVPSERFKKEFDNIGHDVILGLIDDHTRRRSGGIVGSFSFGLRNKNGVLHEFQAESFFNQHYLVTLVVHQRKISQA